MLALNLNFGGSNGISFDTGDLLGDLGGGESSKDRLDHMEKRKIMVILELEPQGEVGSHGPKGIRGKKGDQVQKKNRV